MTREILLSKIGEVAERAGLTFDGPGTHNFRKVRLMDAYHIYFRSMTVKGSPLIREIWMREGNTLARMLRDAGFTTIECKGGCADWDVSFFVG